MKVFHDLLPEKFRKALRSVVPYAISNQIGSAGVVKILATAETIALAGADDWTPILLMWTGTPGDSNPEIEFIKYTNGYSGAPTAMAANGDLVGLFAPADSTGGFEDNLYSDVGAVSAGKPGRLVHIGFGTVGPDEVSWGWDPPMDGDPPPGTVPDPRVPDMSKKPVEWWTSVPAPAIATQPIVIAVVFGSATEAQSCELYIPKADGNAASNKPNSADLISIPNTALTARRTPLKITAKASQAPSKPQEAEVWVIPKGTTFPANSDPARSKILALLKVYVLPALRLPVSIWRVKDDASPTTALPAGIPSNADIITVLKDVFLQAGIEPYLDGGSDTPVSVRYDTKPKLGELLYTSSASALSEEENLIASNSAFAGKKLRIFLVNAGTKTSDLNGYSKPPRRTAFVYAGNFTGGDPSMVDLKYTCAHEIGHILGLSTRNATSMDPSTYTHESGRLPRVIVYNDQAEYQWHAAPTGLMQPYGTSAATQRRWLRHEDWKRASETAKQIISSQQ